MSLSFISLFAGIGGFDLGLERTGMRCVAQVEIDPFCCEILKMHWPAVARFNDVRAFGRTVFPRDVDLVCGGFPCQDISIAGKGAGLAGERSGLWREMARIINEYKPAWVLAENVPALRHRGADCVLSDLEQMGYTPWAGVVGAWATGTPHRRDRVWIVAYAPGYRQRPNGKQAISFKAHALDAQSEFDIQSVVADTSDARREERRCAVATPTQQQTLECGRWRWPAPPPSTTIRMGSPALY